jgi:hypothetical protein
MVAPFQLRPKKKIQLSVHCYAIPITTGKKRYSRLAIIRCAVPIAIIAPFQSRPKKRYSHLSVVTPFQLRPEKKDTVVWPSFVTPFQLPLLRRSNYDRKKKIQSSVRCYAIPITTGKKRYSRLAIIRCAIPIAIVAPFQL